MKARETYIGDGLYASFDGYQIKLRAPRIEGDHEVFLEPIVMKALTDFWDKIVIEAVQERHDKEDQPDNELVRDDGQFGVGA